MMLTLHTPQPYPLVGSRGCGTYTLAQEEEKARQTSPSNTGEAVVKRTFTLPPSHATNTTWLDASSVAVQAYIDANGTDIASSPSQLTSTFYEITSSTVEDLKIATNHLHLMFMAATAHVLNNKEKYNKYFQYPDEFWRLAESSFHRQDKVVSGRMDFSVTRERGIKCYEYNADSASCIMEGGYIQGAWSRANNIHTIGEDAGSVTNAVMVEAWRQAVAPGTLVHFLHDDDQEEKYHTLYMMDLAHQAGVLCKEVTSLAGYTFTASGGVVDADGSAVTHVWKTWSYVTLLQQYAAQGCVLRNEGEVRLIDICFHDKIQMFEPHFSAIPANKAILPVLWDLFPNNKYLLNSSFELTESLSQSGFARKPVTGRCGENVTLTFNGQATSKASAGRFEGSVQVYQEMCPLPNCGGNWVQINSFCCNGRYGGAVTRVDENPIIKVESATYALRVV